MYWDNIPSVILQKQREVFAALDVPLQQEPAHRIPHGTWMNGVVERMDSDDIVIFCDIDAFPLKRSAYDLAVAHAERGAIFCHAPFSKHKKNKPTYAGPLFMECLKRVREHMGRQDLQSSSA